MVLHSRVTRMKSTRYHPPLIRQILPWLYVVLFLALAPLLIFYTAGYRYNLKKGLVERNGTVIVDSTPSGAHVEIDGVDTRETTPITFQNVTPGVHAVRVSKSGYHVWEKRLTVLAEQVTFANTVWLWRNDEPTIALAQSVRQLEESPARTALAFITSETTTSSLVVWLPNQPLVSSPLPFDVNSSTLTIDWEPNTRALVLKNDLSTNPLSWWVRLGSGIPFVEEIPRGFSRWTSTELVILHEHTIERLRLRDGGLMHEPLPTNVLDQEQDFQIITASNGDRLSLRRASLLSREWELPSGAWRIALIEKSFVVLRDADRWLAVSIDSSNPYGGEAMGDHPRWLTRAGHPTALLLRRNELWLWELGKEPALLWRQSNPLVQALWHGSGSSVVIATEKNVFMLDLDEREGRLVTPLATCDHIAGMGFVDRELFVAGTRDGKDAVWRIGLE